MTPHEEMKNKLVEYATHLRAGGTALPGDAALMGRSIANLVAIIEWHDHATAAISELWDELSPETREQLLKLGPVKGMTDLSCLVHAAGEVGALAKANPDLSGCGRVRARLKPGRLQPPAPAIGHHFKVTHER